MLTDTMTFDLSTYKPESTFTYSHASQPLFRRNLIRAVELVTGQPKLLRLYREWSLFDKLPGEAVFSAALRKLDIAPQIISGAGHLQRVPRQGGLLLVANHPFGVVDGLALGQLGLQLRDDVRILTNSLLCRVPEVDPYLLPVDFSGTPQARRLTAETRRKAVDLLVAGQVVALFPAGGVATANRPLRGRAVDAPWHPFVGRLATIPGVTTLPVHFAGQNSRLFQVASHTSYPLRLALIFHETRRRMGRPARMAIGSPVSANEFRDLDRDGVTADLRRRCMEIASPALANPHEYYVWPSHIR